MAYLLSEEQTTKQLRSDAKSMLTGALAAFSVFHFIFSCVNEVEAALFIEITYLFSFVYLSLLPGIRS